MVGVNVRERTRVIYNRLIVSRQLKQIPLVAGIQCCGKRQRRGIIVSTSLLVEVFNEMVEVGQSYGILIELFFTEQ